MSIGHIQHQHATFIWRGSNAFARLQRKLIKRSNQHSILAWSLLSQQERVEASPQTPPYQELAGPGHSKNVLLASTPHLSKGCGNVRECSESDESPQRMTNLGLSTTLFILALFENKYVGILNYTSENFRRIKIYPRHEGNLQLSRLAVNNKPLTFSQMRRAQRRSITILNKSPSEESQGYIRSTYSHLDPASYPPWYNPDFHWAGLRDQDNESVWIRNAYGARFIIKSYAFLVFHRSELPPARCAGIRSLCLRSIFWLSSTFPVC